MRCCKFKFFLLTTQIVRSKFFTQFVEKIEKLELSLSKQHNQMLKIRSEMLKIIKKTQNDQARENFPGIFRIPEDFRDTGISRFPGSSKSGKKGNPSGEPLAILCPI